jgi:hypothetical protein
MKELAGVLLSFVIAAYLGVLSGTFVFFSKLVGG